MMRIIKRVKLTMFSLIMLVMATGCSTINSLAFWPEKECGFPISTYSGTTFNVLLFSKAIISGNTDSTYRVIGATYSAVDFPFSLVADTALLPLSVVNDIKSCTG